MDPEVSTLLDQNNTDYKGVVAPTFFRNLMSWIFPILVFAGVWYFLIRRLQGQQAGFMTIGKNKAKVYMENEVNVSFKDAAGVDEAKQELVEVIDFLKEPERFTRIGAGLFCWK